MNPKAKPTDNLMDPVEVAEYLRITLSAFRSMRSRGRFVPASMIGPRNPRWEREDVVGWMKSRKERY